MGFVAKIIAGLSVFSSVSFGAAFEQTFLTYAADDPIQTYTAASEHKYSKLTLWPQYTQQRTEEGVAQGFSLGGLYRKDHWDFGFSGSNQFSTAENRNASVYTSYWFASQWQITLSGSRNVVFQESKISPNRNFDPILVPPTVESKSGGVSVRHLINKYTVLDGGLSVKEVVERPVALFLTGKVKTYFPSYGGVVEGFFSGGAEQYAPEDQLTGKQESLESSVRVGKEFNSCTVEARYRGYMQIEKDAGVEYIYGSELFEGGVNVPVHPVTLGVSAGYYRNNQGDGGGVYGVTVKLEEY